ncbi:MAG: hypothetical protein ABIQ18_49855 [Umezawaea sp.]
MAVMIVIVAIGSLVWRAGSQVVTGADVPVAVRRKATAWRWGGVVAGVAVATTATTWGALGSGLLLGAPLFALFVLFGVVVGELGIRAPAGSTRRAVLTTRRARDYLPRYLATALAAEVGVLTVLLVVTTVMGSADDMGRAGRVLTRQCSPTTSASHGPWAGSFYSVPLAVAVLIGLAVAVIALRRVARRPPPGDPATLIVADDLLRRRSASVVTGACGVLIGIPLIGVSLVNANSLLSVSCHPASWTIAAWSLIALTPMWVALLAWSGLKVLAPSR